MPISKRVKNIEASKSIELSRAVAKLKADNIDVIGLNVGEIPDSTPLQIINATKLSLDDGATKYSNPEGIDPLRDILAKTYVKELELDVERSNIFVGNGSKHILYIIFQILTNPGDEYIIPTPYWVTIPESIKLADGIPKFVDTGLNNLDIPLIEKTITKKTKGIIINSPNNPSGVIYSKDELLELIHLTKKYDLYLISDEAYDKFVFDEKPFSPLNLSDQLEKIIIVKSFSKSFKMTGFRMGVMIADKKIIHAAKKIQSHLSGNPCTFAQYGAIEAIKCMDQIIPPIVEDLKIKRDLSFKLFSQIFEIKKPQGGFYLFCNIKKFIDSKRFSDCNEMALYILEHARVAVLPGIIFGQKNYLRISYTEDLDRLKEAFNRIEKVL